MSNLWSLFPFNTLQKAEGPVFKLTTGSILPTSEPCRACPVHECWEKSRGNVGIPGECRFGIGYERLDEDRIIVGFLSDFANFSTKRSKSARRRYPELRVSSIQLNRAVTQAKALGPAVVKNFEADRRRMAEELKTDPDTLRVVSDNLRKDFGDNLAQSHDFLQLVKLVKGNAEALLQIAHPDLSVQEAAEKMSTEGAIFFSTELMLLKMDSLVYLTESNKAFDNPTKFQVHPYLLKYVRVYRWMAQQKDLYIGLEGSCYGQYLYSSKAVGAVFQGILDNMVKYSPPGSSAQIQFDESDSEVVLSFSSLGPLIQPDEYQQIFVPGYRARAARSVVSEGLGVGLASARMVSDALGLNLQVSQSDVEDGRFRGRYSTQFTLRMQRALS